MTLGKIIPKSSSVGESSWDGLKSGLELWSEKSIKYIRLDCPDDARHNAENLNNQSHLNPPWYFPYKMMNTIIITDLICGWIQIPGNHLSDILAAWNHPDLWPRTTSKGVGGCFSRCRRPTPCVRCAWLVSFAWWDWHGWHVWRWEPLFFSWVGGWKGRKQSKMLPFIFFWECELFSANTTSIRYQWWYCGDFQCMHLLQFHLSGRCPT